ncbi:MAG: bifunctional adenosylcobinamide kinase/adenosylcobinamide-phosphate guanylyltransferase [Massiliimalia sp.]|jgi:adenosylcobinamide kinase/adenosylcobinamide-phosphate guanylyltransferase
MDLVIGGKYQGKLRWAMEHYGISEKEVVMADKPSAGIKAVDHLEQWIGRLLTEGKSPLEEILLVLEQNPDLILLCDEVGNGVVPMERKDREYREGVGRTCCELAKKADRVYRVWCGIASQIK